MKTFLISLSVISSVIVYWWVQFAWVANYLYVSHPNSFFIMGGLGVLLLVIAIIMDKKIKNEIISELMVAVSILLIVTSVVDYGIGLCFIDNECRLLNAIETIS
jgi:hypothetical protein